MHRLGWASLTLIIGTLAAQSAFADWQLNLPRGVTPISQDIYNLHMIAFWVCVGIGVVVFGVLGFALVMHRKSRGHKAADFHEHTTVEILWAVIPLILLIIMAIPATTVLLKMHDTDESALTVKITGYQWKWRYDYLGYHVGYFSNIKTPPEERNNQAKKNPNYLLEVDKPLILPTNRKIRLLMTSNDVIHSWWVPDLGVKKDALPGFINESWTKIEKPGIYRGQCAELCGVNHGFMPVVVVAKPADEFDAWLKEQEEKVTSQKIESDKTLTKDELMDIGKKTYGKYCSVCHQANGQGIPPTFPALKDSPIAKGDLKKHIDVVLNGVQGTTMQAFAQQLSATELAAVITYERNAFGNDMGDILQPADIRKVLGDKVATGTDVTMPDYSTADKPTLVKQGTGIYQRYCASCHGDQGQGKPPLYPGLTETAQKPLDEQMAIVLFGKEGTQMPSFGKWLSAQDLAAVLTYQNNAWNNDKGTTITAKQVKEALAKAPKDYPILTTPQQATPTTQPTTEAAVKEESVAATQTAKPAAADKPALMAEGKKVYQQHCSVCHKDNGEGQPPVFPALKGSTIINGPVDQHISIVLKGKAGTTMQAFGQQLNDQELAAVITYERNAWNGDKGGIVTAEDVQKAR